MALPIYIGDLTSDNVSVFGQTDELNSTLISVFGQLYGVPSTLKSVAPVVLKSTIGEALYASHRDDGNGNREYRIGNFLKYKLYEDKFITGW